MCGCVGVEEGRAPGLALQELSASSLAGAPGGLGQAGPGVELMCD